MTLSAEVIGDRLTVRISDTGVGIPESQFERIFESFEQLEDSETRTQGGTGLGLSVTRQLVELHGGQIEVESTVGEGSCFSFTLAVTSHQAARLEAEQVVSRLHMLHADAQPVSDHVHADDVAEGDFRLLLVDDEPVNRKVLINHLSNKNYQLVEAADGAQALHALEHDGPFDLILLDIMMPGMSGYEVCEQLREQWPVSEMPVLFLTAKNQVVDLVRSFEVGANDYLSKPVSKPELMARVKTHLTLLDVNRNLETKVEERTIELKQATDAKIGLPRQDEPRNSHADERGDWFEPSGAQITLGQSTA